MSAFVAVAGRADRDAMVRALDTQRHRAPDGTFIWMGEEAALAHVALSMDGQKPMAQPLTLDGKTWIAADARIDARNELAVKLACHPDASDPELILRAWTKWHDDCVLHLLGDFAFAVWDGKRLFAARDHAGVKPLFYAETSGALVVASAVAMIRAATRTFPGASDALDDFAIAYFLVGGMQEYPVATTYSAIKRLPPAHALTWTRGEGLTTRRYWSPPANGEIRYRDEREYVDGFLETLDRAVRDRIRGSSAAALMSGGIDSTSIAVTAQRFIGEPLHAYTLSYRKLLQDDEARFASMVAAHSGMEHHVVDRDRFALFDGALHRAEPYDDPLAAPFLEAVHDASHHTRVMFTGQGGDVVLYTSHGYFRGLLGHFRIGTFAREVASHVLKNRALPPLNLRAVVKSWVGVAGWRATFPPWIRREVVERFDLVRRFEAEQQVDAVHPQRPEAQRLLLNPNWSLLFELWDPGQTGMAVELVYPLFDRRVVELLLAYPPMPWFANKHLMREAMRGRLPETVRTRPKTPLPGSPLRLLLPGANTSLLAMLDAAPEVERWVDRKVLATALKDEADDGYTTYLKVLPFCLAAWLADERANVRS